MKTNTFKLALDQGKVKEKDYFLVKYPDGMEALFQLFKTENGYVMWGPPTTEEVLFNGKEGYDNLFALADSQARKEYANDVFEDVHACSLPEREYEFNTHNEFLKTMEEFSKMYDFSDKFVPIYALASRCVYYISAYAFFGLFIVNNGSVSASNLYRSGSNDYSYSYAVRPETIPKPTMEFLEEDCDGSQERPWICLGSQEGENIPKQSEESTNQDEGIINIDKEELMNFIQEGYNWLKKLEECAKNLK